MSDATANPKPFRLQDGDAFGFADDGELVPIVPPEIYNEPLANDAFRIDAGQFLNVLLLFSKDARSKTDLSKISEMVVLLGYTAKCHDGPKSLREAGKWLGCSHVAASNRLNKLKAKFSREFAGF
jgi:hypothetical protein